MTPRAKEIFHQPQGLHSCSALGCACSKLSPLGCCAGELILIAVAAASSGIVFLLSDVLFIHDPTLHCQDGGSVSKVYPVPSANCR